MLDSSAEPPSEADAKAAPDGGGSAVGPGHEAALDGAAASGGVGDLHPGARAVPARVPGCDHRRWSMSNVFHAQPGQQGDQRRFCHGLPQHVLHDGLRDLLPAFGLGFVAAGDQLEGLAEPGDLRRRRLSARSRR